MYNPMERIRKLSGMPPMINGYPPKTHRKCSDWASYNDAVDTVTRDLVDMIIQCQASSLKIATDKALLAGRVADAEAKMHVFDKKRALSEADRVGIEHDIPTGARTEIAGAIEGNGA